jgi:hypothetical protein
MKSIIPLPVFLLAVVIDLHAQYTQEFQFFVKPAISHRYLREGTPHFGGERPMTSYEFGVLLAVRHSEWTIATGISYSRMGYIWGNYAASDSTKKFEVRELFSFIEVPLMLTYRAGQTSSQVTVGLSNNFLLRNKLKAPDYDGDPSVFGRVDGRGYNLSLIFGYTYDFSFNELVTLGVGPTLKFQLMSHGKSDFYIRHLYSVGLTMYATLKFGGDSRSKS